MRVGQPKGDMLGKLGDAMGPSQRQLKMSEEVRRNLSGILTRTDFRDPDLVGIQLTVTEVRLSPDFRHATAFVCRLGRSDVEALLPALSRAAPYLRSCLSKVLRSRHVPELHFQADTAIDYATEIDALMRSPEVSRDLEKKPED